MTRNEKIARITIPVSSRVSNHDIDYCTSENPAEAICEAWLAYKSRGMV